MQEFSGPESSTPGESGGSVSEQLSEQAKERFQQATAQGKQLAKEEKKARKRDDRVAKTIRQFLGEQQYAHFFQLISRLAARDCPSVFILALLSLMHNESREAVEEYIAERRIVLDLPASPSRLKGDEVSSETRAEILLWILRLSLVMSIDTEHILSKLMVDENNIDGTVLQLATFVLVDFFEQRKRPVPFEQLQPLTIKILQDVIEPHIATMEKYFSTLREESGGTEEM
jgi:hypothetical protein